MFMHVSQMKRTQKKKDGVLQLLSLKQLLNLHEMILLTTLYFPFSQV